MAKTVTYTKFTIEGMAIDAANKLIVVNFRISDDAGRFVIQRQAIFYQTLPATLPDVEVLQLTPSQAQTAITLYNELKTALLAQLQA